MRRSATIPARVVLTALGELSAANRESISDALETIPKTPWHPSVDELWERLRKKEVALLTAANHDGAALAAAFFQVKALPFGGQQFNLLDTVALAHGVNATAVMLPQVEAVAREIGCDLIAIPTVRAGLVRVLTEHHGYTARQVTLAKYLQPQN